MSFLRFTLDSSPLDDEGFGLGESQDFVLDSSELDSATYGLAPNAYAFTSGGVASAPLGSLEATVLSLPTVLPQASAPLGRSNSTANAIVSVIASGGSQLGGLTAEMTANGTVWAIANADLGEMTAHIEAVPRTEGGSFGPGFAFVQPGFVPNFVQDLVEPVKIPSVIRGFAGSRLGRMNASASSVIEFSILEDDAEVLLLT